MALYPQATANLALWPEPIEIGYQLLGRGDGSVLAPKLNHLGIADLLFMSSIERRTKHKTSRNVLVRMMLERRISCFAPAVSGEVNRTTTFWIPTAS